MRRAIALAVTSVCLTVGFFLTGISRVQSDSSSDAISASYAKLATAYQAADESAMRSLLAPDVEFTYTTGSAETLAQTVADWGRTRQRSPDIRVSIVIKGLIVRGDKAEADIILTQTYMQSGHPASDVQIERDRWELRGGIWLLVAGHTEDDTLSLDGSVVSHDSAIEPITEAQRAGIISQLLNLAWPVRTAVPDDNLSDLEPLVPAIGSARIVAMGEATHGTSEFFSIKDRILRFLVEKMGFTVFAMEIPWTNGVDIDNYVTTGRGDIRTILASSFAVWDNQEVLDLIEWMRAYNAAPDTHPVLRFVGIDMQDDPTTLTNIILKYLSHSRPSEVAKAAKSLSCLQHPKSETVSSADSGSVLTCVRETANIAKMIAGFTPTPERTGDQNDLLTAEHAAVIASQIASARDRSSLFNLANARDEDMAANTEWFANTVFPEARVALWAHNGHVMSTANGSITTMGTYLRKANGPNYYVIGFAFDSGTVSPNGVSRPIKIASAPSITLESLLGALNMPLFGLNLRSIPASSPLGTYLSSPRPMRMFGMVSNAAEASDSQTVSGVDVKTAFDSLIFVDHSHAAHSFQVPISEVRRQVSVPAGSGGVSWITQWGLKGSDPQNYAAGANANNDDLYLSSSIADLQGWGATVGSIPVEAYRGKRIRFSGEVRAEGANSGGSCWMRVDGPDGATEAFDNMSDRLLVGNVEWKPFEIVLDVPNDATKIFFGLALRGRGKVLANHLRVDAVDTQTPTTGSR